MTLNNFIISYSNMYDINSFYNEDIYIDSINIISDKYKKIIILKKIGIDNLFFYYIIDTNLTVSILCNNDITNILYLNNIILIVTIEGIIKVNILNKTYIYNEIDNNYVINYTNIEKNIKFNNNDSNIIPEIYEIESLDNVLYDTLGTNIRDVKKKKYFNNQIIQCCLNYENNIIIQFKLFEPYLNIIISNNNKKLKFDNSIYDIYIINEKYFLIQFKNLYQLINSDFKSLNKPCTYNDIIMMIEKII